jgi:hypothetical protein
MPCFAVLAALFVPRLTIAALWLATNWFRGLFDFWLWPLLGFLFAPVTLLWYSAVQHWFGGVWGPWQIAGLVVAILLDLSPGAGKRGKR